MENSTEISGRNKTKKSPPKSPSKSSNKSPENSSRKLVIPTEPVFLGPISPVTRAMREARKFSENVLPIVESAKSNVFVPTIQSRLAELEFGRYPQTTLLSKRRKSNLHNVKKTAIKIGRILPERFLAYEQLTQKAAAFTPEMLETPPIHEFVITDISVMVFAHGNIPMNISMTDSKFNHKQPLTETIKTSGIMKEYTVTSPDYFSFKFNTVDFNCFFSNKGSCAGLPIRSGPYSMISLQEEVKKRADGVFIDEEITDETISLCLDNYLQDIELSTSLAPKKIRASARCLNLFKHTNSETHTLLYKRYTSILSETMPHLYSHKIIISLKLFNTQTNMEEIKTYILLGPEFVESLDSLSSLFKNSVLKDTPSYMAIIQAIEIYKSQVVLIKNKYITDTLAIVELIHDIRYAFGEIPVTFIDRSCNTIMNIDNTRPTHPNYLDFNFLNFKQDSHVVRLLHIINDYITYNQMERKEILHGGKRRKKRLSCKN